MQSTRLNDAHFSMGGCFLPHEIALKIFGKLSVKELEKCARVCKTWKDLARDDSLWKNTGIIGAENRGDFIQKFRVVRAFGLKRSDDKKNPLYFKAIEGKVCCTLFLNFGHEDQVAIGEWGLMPEVAITPKGKPVCDWGAFSSYLAASFCFYKAEEVNKTLAQYDAEKPSSDERRQKLLSLGTHFKDFWTLGGPRVMQRIVPTITPALLQVLNLGRISIDANRILVDGRQQVGTMSLVYRSVCSIFSLERTGWTEDEKRQFPLFLDFASRFVLKSAAVHLPVFPGCNEALDFQRALLQLESPEGVKKDVVK